MFNLSDFLELVCQIPPWLLHITVIAMFCSILFLHNSVLFVLAFAVMVMVDLMNLVMRNVK